jgi:hypothetical protein
MGKIPQFDACAELYAVGAYGWSEGTPCRRSWQPGFPSRRAGVIGPLLACAYDEQGESTDYLPRSTVGYFDIHRDDLVWAEIQMRNFKAKSL